MSIDYVVLDKGSLVYTRGHGQVTSTDLIKHERRLLKDSRVKRGYRQLLDYRWVPDDALKEDFLDRLSEVHAQGGAKLRGARYAMVAQGFRWFNLGNEYQGDPYGLTMIVFNDPNTACIWLGVDFTDLVDVWDVKSISPTTIGDLIGAISAAQAP